MEIRKYDLPTDGLTWVGARDTCVSKKQMFWPDEAIYKTVPIKELKIKMRYPSFITCYSMFLTTFLASGMFNHNECGEPGQCNCAAACQ